MLPFGIGEKASASKWWALQWQRVLLGFSVVFWNTLGLFCLLAQEEHLRRPVAFRLVCECTVVVVVVVLANMSGNGSLKLERLTAAVLVSI